MTELFKQQHYFNKWVEEMMKFDKNIQESMDPIKFIDDILKNTEQIDYTGGFFFWSDSIYGKDFWTKYDDEWQDIVEGISNG